MSDFNDTVLQPGDYLVELRFRRPVERRLLAEVLKKQGWDTIVFDEWTGPVIGALPASRFVSSSSSRSMSSVPTSPARIQQVIAPRAPSPPSAPSARASSPASSTSVTSSRAASYALNPQPSSRPTSSRGSNTGPSSSSSSSTRNAQVSSANLPPKGKAGLPGGAAAPDGGAPSTPTAPGSVQSPSDDGGGDGGGTSSLSTSPPSDGGGGGGGGGGGAPSPPSDGGGGSPNAPGNSRDGGNGEGSASGPDAQPVQDAPPPPTTSEGQSDVATLIAALKAFQPGPVPVEPLAGETPDIKALRLANLWRRWKEWGSPFSAAPDGHIDETAASKVNISGESDDTLVRFIATLHRSVRLQDTDAVEWVFVRHLTVSPFEDLNLQVTAFPLKPTHTYEFRLLARDRSTPQKDDVKRTLQSMGFAPMKLALVKRHIRLPNRPGTDLSLWYGIGQWLKVSSAITSDDPLFFESLSEV